MSVQSGTFSLFPSKLLTERVSTFSFHVKTSSIDFAVNKQIMVSHNGNIDSYDTIKLYLMSRDVTVADGVYTSFNWFELHSDSGLILKGEESEVEYTNSDITDINVSGVFSSGGIVSASCSATFSNNIVNFSGGGNGRTLYPGNQQTTGTVFPSYPATDIQSWQLTLVNDGELPPPNPYSAPSPGQNVFGEGITFPTADGSIPEGGITGNLISSSGTDIGFHIPGNFLSVAGGLITTFMGNGFIPFITSIGGGVVNDNPTQAINDWVEQNGVGIFEEEFTLDAQGATNSEPISSGVTTRPPSAYRREIEARGNDYITDITLYHPQSILDLYVEFDAKKAGMTEYEKLDLQIKMRTLSKDIQMRYDRKLYFRKAFLNKTGTWGRLKAVTAHIAMMLGWKLSLERRIEIFGDDDADFLHENFLDPSLEVA